MNPILPRQLDDPSRFGALAAALFSLVGYVFCLFLSFLKLRTEHGCHSFIDDICADRCSKTLTDAASSLWGWPITVYGAALFLVAFVLAARASGEDPEVAVRARMPLVALAWFALATSVVLGLYASLYLGTWCEYCALLYTASIGLFLGAWLACGGRPIRIFRRPLDLTGRVAVALAALGLMTAALFHMNLYRRAASVAWERACEQSDVLALPSASLRVPADGEPAVVAAVFVDLSCPLCRQSVASWRAFQASRRGALELRFYHFPMDCDVRSEDHACQAAKAAECLAPHLPGRELELLDALFALQDGPSPYFSEEHLDAVAATLAPEFGAAGLQSCLREGATTRQVEAHVALAEAHGLRSRPAALLVRMYRGRPVNALALEGGKKDEAFLDRKLAELFHRD